jgi:DNA-directed RNA polymerase subunit RPC12/RpoP
LKELDTQGTKTGIEYLFDLINIMENELKDHPNFFIQEFQTYINQDRERVISAYFTTHNPNFQKILIQGIKSDKIQHWKQLIDLMVTYKYYKKKELKLQLFSEFEEKIKNKICEYLVKKSYLLFFLDLFQDSGFFKAIFLTKKPIEPKIIILLRNYLQKYVHEYFEEILSLGNKITYPKVEIASTLTKNELEKLIMHINFNKTLLQPWEEVFLSRSEDSLPYLLDQLGVSTKKRKEPIKALIKKIIAIDYIQFWKYIGQVSDKKMSKYDNVCSYAFEKSISNLGDLIETLPKKRVSYIAKKIVPKFSSEGKRMLYSFLSISDPRLLDNPKTYELIAAIIDLDPQNYVYTVLLRISKVITIPGLESFTRQLFNNLIASYTYQVFSEVDSYSLNPLTKLIAVYVTEISDKKFFIILKKLVPNLKTDCLRLILVNQTIHRLRTPSGNFSVLDNLIPNNKSQEYSEEGYLFLTEISNRFTGHSTENDINLFIYLNNLQSPVQKPFLEAYFDKISQNTFERLLNDPRLDLSGKHTGSAITKRFTAHPPTNPERYFMTLFRQTKREEIKKAILPLLGEYCSWMNLPFLLELPEQRKYKEEYDDGLKRFAQRFNIASSQTLLKIWSSGLKDIYIQTPQSATMSSIQPKSYQTQCPKCGNPILENQKSCGFCPQRFTCAICFKSVVTTKDTDLVECPQCSNIFHRHHLSASIKMKPECPICHIQLSLRDVSSLSRFQFFFQ